MRHTTLAVQCPSSVPPPPVSPQQCPSMGVAQLGTQGWRSAPIGFRTSTSYHSCCRYTLLLLTFLASNFLLKTFLAAIQRLSKEKSCCSLPRGLPRPRWFFGVNILSTSFVQPSPRPLGTTSFAKVPQILQRQLFGGHRLFYHCLLKIVGTSVVPRPLLLAV